MFDNLVFPYQVRLTTCRTKFCGSLSSSLHAVSRPLRCCMTVSLTMLLLLLLLCVCPAPSGARGHPRQPRDGEEGALQARRRQALAAGQADLRGAQGAPQGQAQHAHGGRRRVGRQPWYHGCWLCLPHAGLQGAGCNARAQGRKGVLLVRTQREKGCCRALFSQLRYQLLPSAACVLGLRAHVGLSAGAEAVCGTSLAGRAWWSLCRLRFW